MQVLSIIEEMAIEPELIDIFIENFQKIYKLGNKSQRFFLKMLSNEKAFDHLMKLDNWIEKQLEYWKKEGIIKISR